MATKPKEAASRMRAGIGQSVEVQHGSRGVLLMLRRGLHGAKNWVLGPDGEGLPASPMLKLGRFAVVLLPVWIVASASTGGPERGGSEVGVGQSLLAAFLVTLVGLGFFSARERRQGREEPWRDLPDLSTVGDAGEAETLVDPAPEAPTQVVESSQVSATQPDDGPITPGDNPDVSDQSSRNDEAELPTVVQPLPREAEEAQVRGPFEGVHDPVHGGAERRANQDEVDSSVEASRPDNFPSVAPELRSGLQEPAFPLVSLVKEGVQTSSEVPPVDWSDVDTTGITESDATLLEDEPTTPLRPQEQRPVQDSPVHPTSPLVSLEKEPMRQPLQGELQVLPATPGPFPVEDAPVAVDWFLTRPDAAEPEPDREQPQETAQEVISEPLEASDGVEEETAPEAPEEAASEAPAGLPPVVLMYLATQSPTNVFTQEEREKAKGDVIAWARDEVGSGRLSQARVAQMVGVNKTTVGRWLNRDPWADTETR